MSQNASGKAMDGLACTSKNAGIETTLNDVRVQTDWIQTPAKPRPQSKNGTPSVEMALSAVPEDATSWVGFSGGNDSYRIAHHAMSNGLADGVCYCDTGSGLVDNIEFVRRVCDKHGWPLAILPPRKSHEFLGCRYGWVGPDYHSLWFNYVKGGGFRALANQVDGKLELITGVYRGESDKRVRAVTEKRQESTNFSGWYVSPWYDSEGHEFEQYGKEHNLAENQTYNTINRSGDCYCLAYAGRDEIVELLTHYPQHYSWLMNCERRVQEYRGRVMLLEDKFPETVSYARNVLREQNGVPYPLMHDVLENNLPAHARWAKSQSRKKAILRAMQEPTSWVGHGGESTQKLQRAAEQADATQSSLCDQACNRKSVMGIDPEVKQATENAKELSEQQELGVHS